MIRRASVGLIAEPVPGILISYNHREGTLAPQGGPPRRRVVVTIEEEFDSWEEATRFVAEIERRDTMRDYVARCDGSGVIARKRDDKGKVRAGHCGYCNKRIRVDEQGRLVAHTVEAEVRRAGKKKKPPVGAGLGLEVT